MPWFDVSDGRLRFRGRITPKPFTDWTSSPEGAAMVDAAARQTGFSLFGRSRSARRRICRELRAAVSNDSVRAAIAAEPDRYLAAWTELAYAPSPPRLHVNLHRLVVIPRTMIVARTLPAVTARLAACAPLANLDDSFKAFLFHRTLREMDDAIQRAQPSSRNPILAHESWACVALDRDFVWIDPLWSGSDWLGHVMLYEMPSRGIQRRERRELDASIERLKADLPAMSRVQRGGVVRTATADLCPVKV
jgi:hypothetical protein